MERASAGKAGRGNPPEPEGRGHLVLATALAAAAVALMAVIYMGLTVGLDVAVASSATPPAFVDGLFRLVAAGWSPEASLLIGIAGTVVLLRMGAGIWSAAALGFLLLVPLEIVIKLAIERPEMPDLLKPWPGYAVVGFAVADALINGSPMRTAFVCLFWAVLLWERGGGAGRAAAIGAVAVNLVSMATRIYGQYHWLSGELGGELLGAALAIGLAPLVAARLRGQPPGQTGSP